MAGEINGTKVLIRKGGATIVGQMEATVTFNGTPIDISNKSTQDWVTLMDGELSAKQWVFTGTMIYNNDAVYRQVRADAIAGTLGEYSVTYTGSGTATDESLTGSFLPNGLSDTLPMGDKVTTSLTFSSSGVVTRVVAADS